LATSVGGIDRDPDVGLVKGHRVVDAVAQKRDVHAEAPLQPDDARLLLGADARKDGGRREALGQLLIVDRLQLGAGHGPLDG